VARSSGERTAALLLLLDLGQPTGSIEQAERKSEGERERERERERGGGGRRGSLAHGTPVGVRSAVAPLLYRVSLSPLRTLDLDDQVHDADPR